MSDELYLKVKHFMQSLRLSNSNDQLSQPQVSGFTASPLPHFAVLTYLQMVWACLEAGAHQQHNAYCIWILSIQ